MKKVLYDKNGIFISIHNGDYQLTELNDGDCLTHEDGTIIIYKESEGEPLFENIKTAVSIFQKILPPSMTM